MVLEFKIATALKDIQDYQRLRFKTYSDPRVAYIKPDDCPDGLETDEFDDISVHMICRETDSGDVLAGVRMTHDSEKGFPLEKYYDISRHRLDRSMIVECSRRVTMLPGRHNDHLLSKATWGIVAFGISYFFDNRITHYICALTRDRFTICRRMNAFIDEDNPFRYECLAGEGSGVEVFFSYIELASVPDTFYRTMERIVGSNNLL